MAATKAIASSPCDHHSACLTVRTGVVELAGPCYPAADHHQDEPCEQGQPEHVEHYRIAEVEVALEEAPAEDGLREVGVDAEDDSPDEEDQEAVEDPAVRPADVRVAALDRDVAEQHAERVAYSPRQLGARRHVTAASDSVLRQGARHAVGEDQHRDPRQHVPEHLERGLEVPEDVAGLHSNCSASSSATSNRSATAP